MIVAEVPTILTIVATPETFTSVAAIPPITSNVVDGIVLPIPTRLVLASARIKSVFTSKPFLTTKFLLTAIWVHSPPLVIII